MSIIHIFKSCFVSLRSFFHGDVFLTFLLAQVCRMALNGVLQNPKDFETSLFSHHVLCQGQHYIYAGSWSVHQMMATEFKIENKKKNS